MRRVEYLTDKREFLGMPAEMLMEKDVITCVPSDSARHVASQLTKFNIGSLPVVDEDGRLLGLVTEFDLLQALVDGRDLGAVRAEEVMTRTVRAVPETAAAHAIIELLNAEHLIRIPVTRDGKLVGVVARRDILFGYIKATAKYWP